MGLKANLGREQRLSRVLCEHSDTSAAPAGATRKAPRVGAGPMTPRCLASVAACLPNDANGRGHQGPVTRVGAAVGHRHQCPPGSACPGRYGLSHPHATSGGLHEAGRGAPLAVNCLKSR